MDKENFRLYVGREISHYRAMEDAKEAAKLYMPKKAELRIEILIAIDLSEADYWAYNYETMEWQPS